MRHIVHLIATSLKYFFDIDHHVFGQTYAVITVVIYSLKMLPSFVANEFYEGSLTIKEDVCTIKNTFIAHKKRWNNSDIREHLVNNIRSFRNEFPG